MLCSYESAVKLPNCDDDEFAQYYYFSHHLMISVQWFLSLNVFLCCVFTELKIPIRFSTGLADIIGNTEPTNSDSAGQNKTLCCFCPKSELDLKKNRDDSIYRKMFEDFLHNSIFQLR